MLLFILFGSIAVVFLASMIVGIRLSDWGNDWDTHAFGNGIVLGLIVIALIVMGIVAINVNTNYNIIQEMITYNEKVDSLNHTYNTLVNIQDTDSDIYLVSSITEYNNDVMKFKNEILKNQENLKNPWINLFTSKAYENMDANAVQYFGK